MNNSDQNQANPREAWGGAVLGRIWALARKRPGLLAWNLGFNLFAALLEGISFVFLGLAVSYLAERHVPEFSGTLATLWGWLPKPAESKWLFVVLVAYALGTQILRSAGAYLGSVCSIKLGTWVRLNLQGELLHRILFMPFAHAQAQKAGELADHLQAVSNHTVEIIDIAGRMVVYLLMIVVSVLLLVGLSPSLTLAAVLLFSGVIFLQRRLTTAVGRASGVVAADTAEMTARTVDTVHGLRLAHSYGLQDRLEMKANAVFQRMRTSNRRMNHLYYGMQAVSESAMLLALGGFLVLAYFVFAGEEAGTSARLATFVAVLNRLGARFTAVQSGVADIVRRQGLLARAEPLFVFPGYDFTQGQSQGLPVFSRELAVEDLIFRYPKGHTNALDGVSLIVRRGEMIGIVGESGSGKSTLTDLLLGLYEPQSGRILVDGADLRACNLEAWKAQVGVVSQDAFFFHESIRDNLRLVAPGAGDAEIEEALRLAQAFDFVSRLPRGLDTIVGERGARFSGGQRQRLALARALVRRPVLLLLDEATSALDSESEFAIQQALETLRTQITMVIVAHRLSTICRCDQIIVMSAGRICDRGSHESLLASSRLYAGFWARQTQSVEAR